MGDRFFALAFFASVFSFLGGGVLIGTALFAQQVNELGKIALFAGGTAVLGLTSVSLCLGYIDTRWPR